ncbi:MAG: ATP-binding cassette domain-containing protein [Candidatus Omnitrophota bacterium]|jgi:ABC-type polysaccharide/polyol phosphate transport system ATPase subunit
MNVIELKNVSEKYRIKFIRDSRVSWEEVWALQDLNLEVAKGEVIGVIGPNGAGKTTLLKLISGMLMADKGTVSVQGRVAVLMELGAGFNPEFTGRENIKLNARIYGLNEDKLEEQMANIISFAGLENFIDAPIKSYSQGMFMRLAFALAIYVDPDILLIDDILAVGDQEAQEKCVKKVFEFKKAGKNIIVVSHDLNIIAKLCDKVILLEKGKIVDSGMPEEVINRYLETVGNHAGIATLSGDKIRLVFNNGKIILSRGGSPVTAGMGGYVMYLAAGQNYWIPSFNLTWRIADSSPEGIIAEGRNSDGAVAQIWNIGFQDNRITLNVELKDKTAKDFRFDLGMNAQYTKWLGRDAFRPFPGFTHKFNYQNLDFGSGRVMSVGLSSDDGQMPPVVLQSGDKDTSIKLFNSGYDQEARIVQMCSANNELLALSLEFLTADEFQERIKEQAERRALEEEQERQRIIFEKEQARQRRIEESQQKIQRDIIRREEERNRRIADCTLVSGDLCFFADLESRLLRISYKDKELTGI